MESESPVAIAEALGSRLKRARLNADLTQVELAKRAGLSRKAVLNAEKGKVTLEALVAVLLALRLQDQLEQFLPEPQISPVALAKLQGNKRQRASGKAPVRSKLDTRSTAAW